MKLNLVLAVLTFSFYFVSNSQTVVFKGIVKNKINSKPIEGASVVVKQNTNFLGYTYTNEKGYYELSINIVGVNIINLEVSSLGFNKFKDVIPLNNQTLFENTIFLSEKIESLSTVVIKSTEKIEINRDTIAYKLSAFKDGTEKTVEDMLKNLPGITIDSNGNIEALGKPIQKILIEGEDLANSNYKIISKNLDVNTLKSIEIIDNYDENPVLKQFLNSQNTVINLKLKDDKKSLLFGKSEAGIGIKKRFLGDINLGLINPDFKFLNLGFMNNVGRNANNQFSNYTFSVNGFNDFNKSYKINSKPLVYLNGTQIDLDEKNYIENQSVSNSLLFNKKISKVLKLKNTLFVYKDNFNKNYSNTNVFLVNPETVTFTEENTFENKDFNFGNNLELQFTPSINSNLLFKNKFNISNRKDLNKILIDEETINQNLKSNNKDFDTQIQYTKKIKNGAFILDGFVSNNDTEQSFRVPEERFLKEVRNANSQLTAKYNSNFNHFGVESTLVFKSNKTFHSYTVGVSNLIESINSNVFNSNNNTSIIDSLSGSNLARNLKPHFRFKLEQPIIEKLVLNTDFDIGFSSYKNNTFKRVFFLPNIDVGLKLNKTKTGNYKLGFEHNSEISRLDKFLNFFLVKSYRNIGLGAERVKPLVNNRFFFSHSFSNIKKRIFFSTSLSYTFFGNSFTTESELNTNFNSSKYIYNKSRNLLFLNTDITTYFDPLNMSMKFAYSHQYSEQPSFVNNENIVSKNYTSAYIITGTTFFKSVLNFRFLTNYTVNKGQGAKSKVENRRVRIEIDAICRFNKKWVTKFINKNFIVNSNFYNTNQIEIEYKPKDNNWTFGIVAQNIFNDDRYSFDDVSDYLQSSLTFRSVPRYGYLYGKIRF